MRIGFDAKRAFQNFTGLGNYSRFIIQSLLDSPSEHEYFAYTPKLNEKVHFSNRLRIALPQTAMPKSLWRSWGINQQLKKDHIDIFHGLSNELPWQIQQSGIKSVVTIHDLIFMRYPELYPMIDRWIYRRKFKAACEQADCIIAISQQTKQDIVEMLQISPSKIEVVYQDCDPAFRKKLPSEHISAVRKKYQLNKPYILCVATIAERKNQLTLVKAFEALHNSEIELVLVGGKSSYQSQIEEYIRQKNLTGVHIINGVPFSDLPALYQGSSLSVYPSIFEGFGIPIVEALHSGVPVIGATGSCLEEAGGQGGIYVNPYDIQDLAHQIQRVLSDSELSHSVVQVGQKHIAKFSSTEIAKELEKIYKKI
ncbi:MAG: glycosyltransferase family 4 protein [Flectobacillus sp.]|uniref:glycosyltransferase family 4 protein n=1 Tax=Flectobacillus sp. TaxID=50419 RepID=UPI003B9A148C